MSLSSELLKEPGVIAAGLYSRKYLIRELEGPYSSDDGVKIATFCAAITQIMEKQGLLLDRLAQTSGWENCLGWAMWGDQTSLISIGESMCVFNTQTTSLNSLVSLMMANRNNIDVKQG